MLTYHVVPGKVMAEQAVQLTEADTAEGNKLAINASSAGVKINDANVIKADILCRNGVIHVIDRVVLPPM